MVKIGLIPLKALQFKVPLEVYHICLHEHSASDAKSQPLPLNIPLTIPVYPPAPSVLYLNYTDMADVG